MKRATGMELALVWASLALFAGGCRNNRPALNVGPVNTYTQNADGSAVVTSYAGRTSAGGGQVTDTTEAEVLKALAEKVDGQNFTYASATRSSVDQPNVAIEQEIENKHKAALKDAADALSAGAQGNYAKAATEAATDPATAGGEAAQRHGDIACEGGRAGLGGGGVGRQHPAALSGCVVSPEVHGTQKDCL